MIWVLPPSISSMAVSHCSVAADGKLDFYKQCRCDQHCLGLYLDQFCFRGNTDSSSLCSDNQPLNRTVQGVRKTFKDVCGNQTLGKRTLIWSPHLPHDNPETYTPILHIFYPLTLPSLLSTPLGTSQRGDFPPALPTSPHYSDLSVAFSLRTSLPPTQKASLPTAHF